MPGPLRAARSAAAWQPDLVIHVGDYFYRDSPCPPGNPACAGNPWGDTWAAAQADFFAPAEPLLKWPRGSLSGNHEECRRTGNAWFRLLDPRPLPKECTDRTEPYSVPIGETSLFVLDTTTAHDLRAAPETVAYFATQLAALTENRPVWLLSHKPFWAFGIRGQTLERDPLPHKSDASGCGPATISVRYRIGPVGPSAHDRVPGLYAGKAASVCSWKWRNAARPSTGHRTGRPRHRRPHGLTGGNAGGLWLCDAGAGGGGLDDHAARCCRAASTVPIQEYRDELRAAGLSRSPTSFTTMSAPLALSKSP